MDIRRATVNDIMGMQNCNLHNLPENYHFRYYQYHISTWPNASFVATTRTSSGEERVVGYALAKMEDDAQQQDSNKHDPKSGHITSLSVMRSYRRMGLADKLMNQALRALAESYGAEYVSLHVRESNKAALHLYRDTLKFQVQELVTSYYADGENAYSMKKDLAVFIPDQLYDDDDDLLAGAITDSTLKVSVSA